MLLMTNVDNKFIEESFICQSKVELNVSIKNIGEDKTERSTLCYHILLKQVQNVIQTALASLPRTVMSTGEKGQFVLTVDPDIVIMPYNSAINIGQDNKKKLASAICNGESLFKEAVLFIEENYYRDLTLEEVAKRIYFSRAYFCRIFKEFLGCSFMKYLTQIRMEHGRSLLRNTNLKISEIAKRVGYHDTRYFCVVFKKNEGCTPTEYRRHVIKPTVLDGKVCNVENQL